MVTSRDCAHPISTDAKIGNTDARRTSSTSVGPFYRTVWQCPRKSGFRNGITQPGAIMRLHSSLREGRTSYADEVSCNRNGAGGIAVQRRGGLRAARGGTGKTRDVSAGGLQWRLQP